MTSAAIFVAPAERGAGIGSALLEHAKRLREQLSLTVYAANNASIAFYRRHGFQVAGEQLDAHRPPGTPDDRSVRRRAAASPRCRRDGAPVRPAGSTAESPQHALGGTLGQLLELSW